MEVYITNIWRTNTYVLKERIVSNYDYLGLKRRDQLTYKNKIRERDAYTCQLCGNPGREVDHIIPWAISHDSSPSNLRVLCKSCNLKMREQRQRITIPEDQYESYLRSELARYEPVPV
jgi:5-methylcytosine-specific restriction endonuclease McrA